MDVVHEGIATTNTVMYYYVINDDSQNDAGPVGGFVVYLFWEQPSRMTGLRINRVDR